MACNLLIAKRGQVFAIALGSSMLYFFVAVFLSCRLTKFLSSDEGSHIEILLRLGRWPDYWLSILHHVCNFLYFILLPYIFVFVSILYMYGFTYN